MASYIGVMRNASSGRYYERCDDCNLLGTPRFLWRETAQQALARHLASRRHRGRRV